MQNSFDDHQAPTDPPSLLSNDQLLHLTQYGWLFLPLPDHLNQQIRHVSRHATQFFEKDQDHKVGSYPASHGTEHGYYHVPEEKEYVTFRHAIRPDSVLEHEVAAVWSDAGQLLHRILCDLARALDLPCSIWSDLLADSLEFPQHAESIETTTTLLRLFRYFPTGGFATQHVDIGLLTLCIGDGKGLQVLDTSCKPAQYVDVQGPTVLLGETLRVLFGSMLRSGLHRVVANPEGRSSIVFALRPSLKFPLDLANFGGDGTVDIRQLWDKLKASKYNINATKDVRDQQREQKRAQMGIVSSADRPG